MRLSQSKNTELFAKSCRRSIIQMTSEAKSGHPGGSLSCIDYLSVLYTRILENHNEPVIISNGHISPAVYAVLAELNIISKEEVIQKFRKAGSPFEGHVTRHVPGIWYSTGPLGAGVSAATGFALAEKLKKTENFVYAVIGDGESEEGQMYEMMNFAKKYRLDNLIVFLDSNKVQLSDSLKNIMPIDPAKFFMTAGWAVIEINGHNHKHIYKAIKKAQKVKNKPVLIVGNTIMGKGVSFMEKEGKLHYSTWHGKTPNTEETEIALKELALTKKENKTLELFTKNIPLQTKPKVFSEKPLAKQKINTGEPRLYDSEVIMDCRTAYGNALLDLVKKNKNIVALTADLAESVKTHLVQNTFPGRHFDCGVAEQQMVSCSGGLSLHGFVPFCSTFGVFMTSRAKDQARVNDINATNVKMVATHCGLSVGEDGPTHQAIDDAGSFLGFPNTFIVEPADPNHCDRIIRYVASHYGNFYVRMGRHKLSILTKQDGTPFYDKNYSYTYGQCDVLRPGEKILVIASGSVVHEALKAWESLQSFEIVIASSLKKFDNTLKKSLEKANHVITIEDHNTKNGLGSQIAKYILENTIPVSSFHSFGTDKYELSGTVEKLYKSAKIDSDSLIKYIKTLQ
ncbi:MAG: transketolase [Candidatus Magasanikbacteria bacterium]